MSRAVTSAQLMSTWQASFSLNRRRIDPKRNGQRRIRREQRLALPALFRIRDLANVTVIGGERDVCPSHTDSTPGSSSGDAADIFLHGKGHQAFINGDRDLPVPPVALLICVSSCHYPYNLRTPKNSEKEEDKMRE